jgi:hypothetical protein
MSVDYTLLPVFTGSRRRQEEAREGLAGRWPTDPRHEVELINDLRADLHARVRQHIDELDYGSRSGTTAFPDGR